MWNRSGLKFEVLIIFDEPIKKKAVMGPNVSFKNEFLEWVEHDAIK